LAQKISVIAKSGGNNMARANGLRDAAIRVGSAVGRVDAKAHKAARKAVKAAEVARQELVALTKRVDALETQLMQSTQRLKTALK
jgi:polyhydroxyalkanoate synthesis regulator phasin